MTWPHRAQKRSGFADRRATRSAHQLRADWVAAVMLAGSLAQQAERETPDRQADFGQNLTRLSLTVRDLAAENFPVLAPSARAMAGAFLLLARQFAHPAWSPEARTACAPFLRAGADCIDRLIDSLRAAEAQAGRRVLGEREDD